MIQIAETNGNTQLYTYQIDQKVFTHQCEKIQNSMAKQEYRNSNEIMVQDEEEEGFGRSQQKLNSPWTNQIYQFNDIPNKKILSNKRRNPLQALFPDDIQSINTSSNQTSPFITPPYKGRDNQNQIQWDVYIGFQEYEYGRKDNEKEYTTIYFFKIINRKNQAYNYYHEIVVQSELKKFYFSIIMKKLIGYLRFYSRTFSSGSYQRFNIYCTTSYNDYLLQITDCNYKITSNSQMRSFKNLESVRNKYQSSNLKFNVNTIQQSEMEQQYLSQKQFPVYFSSIRIPNQYSNRTNEEFLDTSDFNNYLSTELHELYQQYQDSQLTQNDIFKFSQKENSCLNDQIQDEVDEIYNNIIPYYDSPILERERSRSRSPLKIK